MILKQGVLETEELVTEIRHCHHNKDRDDTPRYDDVLAGLDVLHGDPIFGNDRLQFLPPSLVFVENPSLFRVFERNLGEFEVFDEFRIGVFEEDVVVDQRLARDDAEEVDEAFGGGADVVADGVAAGGGIEDGEVDVGVGVGGVEEAAEGDGVGGFPELENAVDIEEVVEEAAVLVPALAGTDGAEDGEEGGEVDVDGFELAAEEGTS